MRARGKEAKGKKRSESITVEVEGERSVESSRVEEEEVFSFPFDAVRWGLGGEKLEGEEEGRSLGRASCSSERARLCGRGSL